jgi:glycosyltransferase involved in cell wall biosynthesis
MILDKLKWGAISASEAMVLSSHGENFGVSIVESLSCSKPVLTTNKVNIYREILNSNAGLISKNKVNSFFSILKKFKNFDKKKIRKMNKNSYECFKSNFDLSSSQNSLGKFLIKDHYNI